MNTKNTVRPELQIEMETIQHHRYPPPPYSLSVGGENIQPVIHQTIIVQPRLKDSPIMYNCPNCNEISLTKVKYINSQKTHMISGFICGFTWWCALCCLAALPYMLTSCKKIEHYCSNCDSFLGAYS